MPATNPKHVELISRACHFIEAAEYSPKLDEVARWVGVSSYHLHRIFKSVTGLTPAAWARATRADRVRSRLTHGESVTDAIYDAGYQSSSRFYDEADQVLGMSPRRYRTGGRDVEIRFAVGQCSLGSILVAQSRIGICAIAMGDDPGALVRDLQNRFSEAELVGGDAAFERTVAQIVGFVEAPQLGLELPLDIRGTAFQRRVWEALRRVPPGQRLSYTELAQSVGAPKSVRAVARACAANELAVAIPCHRVVRKDGGLSGYRWGVERKQALLDREASQ